MYDLNSQVNALAIKGTRSFELTVVFPPLIFYLSSNLHGHEAESLTLRPGASVETPSPSLQPVTLMKRMMTSFSIMTIGGGKWRSNPAPVCQLLSQFWHRSRPTHFVRNHTYNILPKTLVESKHRSPGNLALYPLRLTEGTLQIARTNRKTEQGSTSELKIRWGFPLPPLLVTAAHGAAPVASSRVTTPS